MDIDFILTSPPYDNHITYGGQSEEWKLDYPKWINAFFDIAFMSLSKKGSLVFINQRKVENFIPKAKQIIKLQKPFPEYAYVYGDIEYPDNLIQTISAKHKKHPCIFSDKTVRYFLDPLCRNAFVVDPFAGTGTVINVGYQMGFTQVLGIEKEKKFITEDQI